MEQRACTVFRLKTERFSGRRHQEDGESHEYSFATKALRLSAVSLLNQSVTGNYHCDDCVATQVSKQSGLKVSVCFKTKKHFFGERLYLLFLTWFARKGLRTAWRCLSAAAKLWPD